MITLLIPEGTGAFFMGHTQGQTVGVVAEVWLPLPGRVPPPPGAALGLALSVLCASSSQEPQEAGPASFPVHRRRNQGTEKQTALPSPAAPWCYCQD